MTRIKTEDVADLLREARSEIERLREENARRDVRIAVLEGLLVKYGGRVRMATAWPESVQPAIDEAFANEGARAALTPSVDEM